jgi:prolyl 4-hydroxylase
MGDEHGPFQALRVYENEDEKTIAKADALEYLAFSAYVQGNLRRALRLTEELLQVEPDHPRALGNKAYYENALREAGGTIKKRGQYRRGLFDAFNANIWSPGEDGFGDTDDPEEVTIAEENNREDKTFERLHYEKLCRGEEDMTEE